MAKKKKSKRGKSKTIFSLNDKWGGILRTISAIFSIYIFILIYILGPTNIPLWFECNRFYQAKTSIIIANFNGEGETDTRIFASLDNFINSHNLTEDVSVNQVTKKRPSSVNEASRILDICKSTIVIWGIEDIHGTDVSFIINENINPFAEPPLGYRVAQITEILPDLNQSVPNFNNNSIYIIEDIPNSFEYLLLYTIGFTAQINQDYELSIDYLSQAYNLGIEIESLYESIPIQFNKKPNLRMDRIFFIRGNAYYYLEKYESALSDFNSYLEIVLDSAIGFLNRGNVYLRLGNLEKAMDNYHAALNINPDSTYAINNLGISYERNGNTEDAISNYLRAIEINPKYPAANYNLGHLYFNQGLYDESIRFFTAAIDSNSDYLLAYSYRGEAYLKINELHKAKWDFQQTIRINTSYATGYHMVGFVLDEQNQYHAAIDFYNIAIKLNPDSSATFNDRAVTFLKLGENDKALDDLNMSITLNPNYWGSFMNRSNVHQSLNNLIEALNDRNSAIILYPECLQCILSRGELHKILGNKGLSIQDFEYVLSHAEVNSHSYNIAEYFLNIMDNRK